MHKLAINRARLNLRLRPTTPILVKSGDKAAALVHVERPDLMCVRTHHAALGETVYVPGSSLKGVVRSAAERVLRSIGLPPEVGACDPLRPEGRCQKDAGRRGDEIARSKGSGGEPHPMAEVYRMLCLACRTFGSQALASRIAFADAYPPSEELRPEVERRNGVAIDRRTGGPSRGKLFDMEVVVGGAFDTSIHLSNYELWQLALVSVVLRDIQDGFVRIGSSKTRGLGHVDVELRSLVVDQRPVGGAIAGVGQLAPDLREPYGLRETGGTVGARGEPVVGALGERMQWSDTTAWAALDATVDAAWPGLLSGSP